MWARSSAFTQPVGRAPLDDLDLVVDPVGDEGVQAQRARHPVDQGEHVRPRTSPSWVLKSWLSTTRGWSVLLRPRPGAPPVQEEESSEDRRARSSGVGEFGDRRQLSG